MAIPFDEEMRRRRVMALGTEVDKLREENNLLREKDRLTTENKELEQKTKGSIDERKRRH